MQGTIRYLGKHSVILDTVSLEDRPILISLCPCPPCYQRAYTYNKTYLCSQTPVMPPTTWISQLLLSLRLKPIELCDGNCHRNKTIVPWSNGIESLQRKSSHVCIVFPLSNDFIIENGHFRLKHKRNGRESSKSIENKCTH